MKEEWEIKLTQRNEYIKWKVKAELDLAKWHEEVIQCFKNWNGMYQEDFKKW